MIESNRNPAYPKVSFGVAVALIISGCSEGVLIREAAYARISDIVRVQVQLSSNDAELIRDEQIYLKLTTLDCKSGQHRYPAEAFVGDKKVSGFDFPVAGEAVSFYANIPDKVFDLYQKPCVILEGGSYLGREVVSKPVPLEP